jgi:FKBP-type peptidyl-prolyl cis-trans isomerase FklB
MKVRILACIITLCVAGPLFGEEAGPSKEIKDKWSYTLGVELGNTLKKQSTDINVNMLQEGIKDVFSGAKIRFTDKEMAEIKATMESEMSTAREKRTKALADKNRKEEERFLSENKGKEGVVALPSGLQYKVLKNGAGPVPKEDDQVSVHYRVARTDGTEIESSYKKGEPGTFALDNVIPGWKEGVCMMKEGSKWQFYIPSKLAYGEDGVGEVVGPNSMLVFDLELVKIMDKSEGKSGAGAEEKAK